MPKIKFSKPSLNALQHGAFAETIILPDENPDEFERLLRRLVAEWCPSGPAEEDAVCTLAKCIWRKRHIRNLCEQVPGDDRTHLTSALLVVALEGQLGFDASGEVHFLREMFQSRSERDLQLVSEIIREMRKRVQAAAAAQNSGGEPDQNRISHLEPVLTKGLRVAEGSSMTGMAKELVLEEHLDRMIERALRRLGQMKAMKEVIALKQSIPEALAATVRQIEAPAIEPPAQPDSSARMDGRSVTTG